MVEIVRDTHRLEALAARRMRYRWIAGRMLVAEKNLDDREVREPVTV
jgi:hypothetical protein